MLKKPNLSRGGMLDQLKILKEEMGITSKLSPSEIGRLWPIYVECRTNEEFRKEARKVLEWRKL